MPGGGVALLRASQDLDSIKTDSFDEKLGVDMIKAALQQPIKTIASNAGQEGSLIVGRLLEKYAEQDHMGYNAATNEFVDMFAAGVVDPVLVTKQALTDAGSVATLLFTSEAAIVEVPASSNPTDSNGSSV